MPHVHHVASLLKRRWLRTHQGAVRPRHIDYDLDEFSFRFNLRASNHPGLLTHWLLEQAVKTTHAPFVLIAGGKP